MTHGPADIARMLETAGLEPSRALGQNFVADPNTVRRVARLAGVEPGDRVVEVGPGLGSLTLALVEAGAEVVAVEADRHLVPVLGDILAGHPVRVVHADAMTFDWVDELDGVGPWKLVANLPYNIATPLVLEVLARVPVVHQLLVMVQREVAERLAAAPGTRTYGIPSVKVAWYGTASLVGKVPASVFVPRPRVESALVAIHRRAVPDHVDRDELFGLVETAFGQRRKMLRRSLGGTRSVAEIESAGIDPAARPEQLSLADWIAICGRERT